MDNLSSTTYTAIIIVALLCVFIMSFMEGAKQDSILATINQERGY